MFTISDIAEITGGRIIGEPDGEVSGISTDSRTVTAGELFVPLVGERFDGHDFLPTVIEAGVTCALAKEAWLHKHPIFPSPLAGEGQGGGDVTSSAEICSFTHPLAPSGPRGSSRQGRGNTTIIAVPDTLQALGDLAAAFRRRFDIPLVGITGSNGKTTCKEMLATILEQIGPGLKTSGNLNNLIGLPQMLFRLRSEHGWGVLEMGMSEPGEINRLAEITAPQVGIVLNAFPAHLESMGSVESVARAKGELLLRLQPGGCAIFNSDDPLIAIQPSPPGVRRLSFGLGNADVRASRIELCGIRGQRFFLHLDETSHVVTLAAFGRHSIYNALAAAAAAHALGLPPEIIVNGLETFRPYEKRFRLEEINGLVLIDDSYNANPASLGAALATLADLKGNKRAFVVFGDMLELGDNSDELHRIAGVQSAQIADRLYVFGAISEHIAEGAISAGLPADSVLQGLSHDQIAADILNRATEGDFVLVKGSRGMKMEHVAEEIRAGRR